MESRALRSLILLVESVVFTVIVPEPWSAVQYAALLVLCVGVVTYFWCLWDFVVSGRGIPLPLDHPKHLVVRGLYRYVRNPM